MQIILLSGGSGKRLWPLSNDVRSKQFLKLLTDKDGNSQSMVQRVCGQIRSTIPDAKLTIATNAAQAGIIKEQLGENVDIVLEPERRDTFPAIALACAYLFSQKNIGVEETVVVLPCDMFTEAGFFRTFSTLDKLISAKAADIALIGMKPTFATSKYGYIVPAKELDETAYSVSHFVEKPIEDKAAKLIEQGAYWNGGVFAFKLGKVLEIAKKDTEFDSFAKLHSVYGKLEKTSFDYKVVEKAERTAVVPYRGKWTDIGTWRTLADEMPVSTLGKVTQERTKNTLVINELEIPLITLGVKDLVIVASSEGILVSDMVESSHLKPLVDGLENLSGDRG